MLNNIGIKARLLLLTAFMCLMILTVGYVSLLGIRTAAQGAHEVYDGSVDAINNLSNLQKQLNIQVITPLQKLHDSMIPWEEAQKGIRNWLGHSNDYIDIYLRSFSDKEAFAKGIGELEGYIKTLNDGLKSLEDIIRKENREDFNLFIDKDLYALADPVNKQADIMIQKHIEETKKDYEDATQSAEKMTQLMIACIALSIIASIILSIFIINSILTPLSKAVKTIDQVAAGDNTMEIQIRGKDESSKLMGAVSNMNESALKMTNLLQAISNGDLTVTIPIRSQKDILGKGLVHMVDRLRKMISEIQSEVNVLSGSTEEIVTSVNEVSTGTAETAAAVTETTSTVEELKQTAHISADKAKDVLANAEETLRVVKNSENTLHLTIEEMNQIEGKMQIISQSIVKLSEHSLAIGEIINTVNNLAEQSNLLAVNAAIEAAKAGDQGKSFGVVAQEIRTLAEQSKEATVQVKAILNDIQNSTSAAVLATEQGSKAVSKGVAQSSQMSDSIHALSTSISRVAQAANQITISSQQQLVGIDQVTVAMSNINDSSNQHVEHMRQIEISVGSLNEVASSLRRLVNQYKISWDHSDELNEILEPKLNEIKKNPYLELAGHH